jgi:glucose dehydrogenase
MTRIRHVLVLTLSAVLITLVGAARPRPATHGSVLQPEGTAAGEWRHYGGDPGGTRFSPLRQITPANVARLERAWTYHIGEVERLPNISPDREPPGFQATPLIVDGVLYLVTPSSRAIALDSETGRELWQFDPQAGTEQRGYHQHRGLAYWEAAEDGSAPRRRILYGTLYGELICLAADTGEPCAGFGANGRVDLRRGAADRWPDALYAVTSPPAIYRNLVIVGARLQESPAEGPSGVIRAFDVRTGQLAWQFHAVPRPGEFGHDTWEGDSWQDRSGVNAWSIMSVDVERGVLFIPFGAPAYDFYGGDREGQNLFANSLVAVDARTGERIWHFQMVHHDIWDYDLPAQPVLATGPPRSTGASTHSGLVSGLVGGLPPAAVVQVTKMGLVFVLDRETGQPLFPVEQRPVPSSDVPGESAWPTQPFPKSPPPLVRHTVRLADLSTVTPDSAEQCRKIFASITRGKRIYAPIGTELTLMLPGTLGGANWSGAAFSPSTGYLYVNVNELPLVVALDAKPDEMPRIRHYQRFVDANGWPCVQPPWGTLAAVDVARGEIAWQVPLGRVDPLIAAGVPPTGLPSLGGPIVTAGGVIFIAGTTDSRIRAFDARTGEEVWMAELAASGHATPATYLGKRTGRQYVVIAAGGGGYLSPDHVSDELVAFALPESVPSN